MVKRLVIVALTALWALSLVPVSVDAATAKPSRTWKYQAEHHARIKRHRTRKPGWGHARNAKYAAEHRKRMHRHRAHMRHVNRKKMP